MWKEMLYVGTCIVRIDLGYEFSLATSRELASEERKCVIYVVAGGC